MLYLTIQMLIKSHNKGIYERILTDKSGRLVRVQFAVVEVDGVMRGRVISVTPVVSVSGKIAAETTSEEVLCLPISVTRDIATAVESIFVQARISPYASFEFFMSQPTRAPSL